MYIRDSWQSHRFFWGPITLEFHLLSGSFGIELDIEPPGAERNLLFSIRILILSFYFGISASWLGRITEKLLHGSYEGRTIGLRVFDWAIWWECWAPNMSWSKGEPWWMRWTWHPIDTLLGRQQHSSVLVSKQDAWIPMPESAYPCTVELQDETWKRPRAPWSSHRIRRAHIDCPNGVPHPGKGENPWDCGDDATYSLTCPSETIEHGIAQFVESVLGRRRRYGGTLMWDKPPLSKGDSL